MKANELMQGYIVLYEYDGQKFPARVIEIYRNSALVESINGEYEPIEIDEDKIFPVSLTAEILEKNGFTSYGEAWYLPENKATGNEKILVGFYMYETHISVRNGSKCFDNSVPCEYRACAANRHVFVHELQHALRLCGILKEIEL